MFAAMAELEASTITERVMSGKQQKAKTGGYNGGAIPFAYTYQNGAFTVNADEAETVRGIFEKFLSGQSMNSIAVELNDRNVPTQGRRPGSQWYAMTIRQILQNGAYAGLSQWDGVETVDSALYPSIIDIATYEAAHKRLQALRPGRQLESEIVRRQQTGRTAR